MRRQMQRIQFDASSDLYTAVLNQLLPQVPTYYQKHCNDCKDEGKGRGTSEKLHADGLHVGGFFYEEPRSQSPPQMIMFKAGLPVESHGTRCAADYTSFTRAFAHNG